ncbi:MAG: hypothetical protein K9J45_21180 [Bacteroidales bacterium]|nr:hypothetical protein [Bacteroidales bacterium]
MQISITNPFRVRQRVLPAYKYRIHNLEITKDQVVVKMFVPPSVCKPKLALDLASGSTQGCCS